MVFFIQEPAGSLAAAAKALSRKKKPAPQEDKEGQQLTLDMFGLLSDPSTPSTPEMEQPQAEPAAPETAAAAEPDVPEATANAEPDIPEAAVNTEPENPAARYDLGYGHMGNGLTVWNRLEEVHGDYKTLAHIYSDRSIVFFDTKLPEEINERIREIAATSEMTVSATQDAPVFSTPPQEPERVQDMEQAREPEPEPEKAQDASVSDNSEPETAGSNIVPFPAPEDGTEPTGAGAEQTQKTPETSAADEPNLTPNVEEYLNLKAAHPDKLVGVQVGETILFYGTDAEEAAPALEKNVITREIPDLGTVSVTGATGWQSVLKKLLEHGKSVVLARPDAERGKDAPYEIIKERSAADYIPVGMELTIDGRLMKIDSVDYNAGTVSLQDMELRGWFPIFRSESIPFVRQFVEEREQQTFDLTPDVPPAPAEPKPVPEPMEIDGGQITETPAQKQARRRAQEEVGGRVFPSEIILQPLRFEPERHNFQITDENLGVGGEKTKYQYNVEAIRTLKQIEAEKRLATPEEQTILSRYVGWGGISHAFEPNDPKWAKEYAELKELLTPAEYQSAQSTVLNAHYARFVP